MIVGLGPENIVLPPPTAFVRTQLSFLGSCGSTNLEIQSVVELLANGKLDLAGSITERVSLEETNKGLEHLNQKIGNPIRIVVVQD